MTAQPPLIVRCNGIEYMRIEPRPSETEEARGIDVVPVTDKAWNQPPFTEADLAHHRRWLSEHDQSLTPDQCAACCAIVYRELRQAARNLRRACNDTGNPVVPAAVAEAIARITALGGQ